MAASPATPPARFEWLDPETAAWSGDIDLDAVRSVAGRRTAFMDPPRVLDLMGVTWFGSAGMSLLLGLAARAAEAGFRITVRGAADTVSRRLAMVGAGHVVDWD